MKDAVRLKVRVQGLPRPVPGCNSRYQPADIGSKPLMKENSVLLNPQQTADQTNNDRIYVEWQHQLSSQFIYRVYVSFSFYTQAEQ